jgi:hypothetical protein
MAVTNRIRPAFMSWGEKDDVVAANLPADGGEDLRPKAAS